MLANLQDYSNQLQLSCRRDNLLMYACLLPFSVWLSVTSLFACSSVHSPVESQSYLARIVICSTTLEMFRASLQ